MPLVHDGDVQAPGTTGEKRFQIMAKRIHDARDPMPPSPNAVLDDADLAVLDHWVAAGAPSAAAGATCNTPVKPVDDAGTSALNCTPDVHMVPGSAFSMPKNADDLYVCYGFDIPAGSKRHLTTLAPKLDNTQIIHHLVLYDTDEATSSTPGSCDIAALTKARLLYLWAPGTGNLELPPEAGYPLESTRHFVVQLHYNNVKHLDGQTDKSGFDFCTTDKLRPNDADALVFGTEEFTIPPKSTTEINCKYTWPADAPPIHLFGAIPHMHQIGDMISTQQFVGGTGAPVDLGSRPIWNFNQQTLVPLDVTVTAGDRIETRCRWKNTTTQPVAFGPTTEDEMCFSYTMYYPHFDKTDWTYRSPEVGSKCDPVTP